MRNDQIVLIPVDRYRIDYEVGFGVPFSRIDALVLRAIARENATSLVALVEIFSLPRRVLIESLVALSRTGWVALGGGDEEFCVTRSGELALAEDILPTPDRISARQASVLVERISGQVASLRDLTYVTTRRLQESGEWDQCKRLPRNETLPSLDAGQAKPLLSRNKNEWIRWVSEPIPQQEAWLQLRIDTDRWRVRDMPEIWSTGLLPRLAEMLETPELSRWGLDEPSNVPPRSSSGHKSWTVNTSKARLLSTGAEHLEILTEALATARSQVMIASAFANADVIESDLSQKIIDATARGVRVDLLWGYSPGIAPEAREKTLKSLSALRKACSGHNMLRFNEKPSGSHAKLLLWDNARAKFTACVGTNNWMSVPTRAYGLSHKELSFVTESSGFVSDICTTGSGLWVKGGGNTGGDDIWHRTSSELERTAALNSDIVNPTTENEVGIDGALGDVTIRQVRDQEHEPLMRDLLLGAKERIGIASHKLGPKGMVRLASAEHGHTSGNLGRQVKVIIGEIPSEGNDVFQEIESLVGKLGGSVAIIPGMHAKVLVADDVVLLSSYNFLSADPFGTAVGAREVGVLIRGGGFSDLVWNWLESQGSSKNA